MGEKSQYYDKYDSRFPFIPSTNVSESAGQDTVPANKMKQEMGSLVLLEKAEGMDKELLAILFAVVSHQITLHTKYVQNISVKGA